ncbi:hypothetical protein BLNAU_12231 [Blattamonas nauphoetae]|uniref:Uncharacterized protein n=1 Tax=Blattamonas nauphoetae TaxID=2049346 RepID=A0ABQ9XK11_9EUKA|nr:hypothetical protein BLNAU_12231 [Blattamonas nauphoetae]
MQTISISLLHTYLVESRSLRRQNSNENEKLNNSIISFEDLLHSHSKYIKERNQVKQSIEHRRELLNKYLLEFDSIAYDLKTFSQRVSYILGSFSDLLPKHTFSRQFSVAFKQERIIQRIQPKLIRQWKDHIPQINETEIKHERTMKNVPQTVLHTLNYSASLLREFLIALQSPFSPIIVSSKSVFSPTFIVVHHQQTSLHSLRKTFSIASSTDKDYVASAVFSFFQLFTITSISPQSRKFLRERADLKQDIMKSRRPTPHLVRPRPSDLLRIDFNPAPRVEIQPDSILDRIWAVDSMSLPQMMEWSHQNLQFTDWKLYLTKEENDDLYWFFNPFIPPISSTSLPSIELDVNIPKRSSDHRVSVIKPRVSLITPPSSLSIPVPPPSRAVSIRDAEVVTPFWSLSLPPITHNPNQQVNAAMGLVAILVRCLSFVLGQPLHNPIFVGLSHSFIFHADSAPLFSLFRSSATLFTALYHPFTLDTLSKPEKKSNQPDKARSIVSLAQRVEQFVISHPNTRAPTTRLFSYVFLDPVQVPSSPISDDWDHINAISQPSGRSSSRLSSDEKSFKVTNTMFTSNPLPPPPNPHGTKPNAFTSTGILSASLEIPDESVIQCHSPQDSPKDPPTQIAPIPPPPPPLAFPHLTFKHLTTLNNIPLGTSLSALLNLYDSPHSSSLPLYPLFVNGPNDYPRFQMAVHLLSENIAFLYSFCSLTVDPAKHILHQLFDFVVSLLAM